MSDIYVPAKVPEDWKPLLAKPWHWKTGKSAKALAHCWQDAQDFPESVTKAFLNSKLKLFSDIKMLAAFPEYKISLPGGTTASQSDLFILSRGNNQLVVITVEGKVDEPFDMTVGEWKKDSGRGKPKRLAFLLNQLELDNTNVDSLRYQLLHRTVSSLIGAREFTARNALMLVHSFSPKHNGFEDYSNFVLMLGKKPVLDSVTHIRNINGVNLYLGWATGELRYLEI
jgi:hypothetical protein